MVLVDKIQFCSLSGVNKIGDDLKLNEVHLDCEHRKPQWRRFVAFRVIETWSNLFPEPNCAKHPLLSGREILCFGVVVQATVQ